MTFSSTAPEQLTSLLAAQKKAFVGAGHVSAELRREHDRDEEQVVDDRAPPARAASEHVPGE